MEKDALRAAIARLESQDLRDLDLDRLAGDGSDRRYWRARYHRADGVPGSLVVMDLLDVENIVKSEEVTLYHPEDDELPFLNIHRFLESIGVPVPRVHAFDRAENFLLLEDLGDVLLLDAVKKDPTRKEDLYRRAVEILADLHTKGTRAKNDRCLAFRQSFELPLLLWEMRHFTEFGIEKRRGRERHVEKKDLEVIEAGYRTICEHLAGLPAVFTHRDYHSRNLLVKNGGIFVIDFQDALLGPAAYDLGSLLRDSYIDIGDGLVDEMVAFYLDLREQAGDGPFDRAAFRKDFDFQCVQRNLKAAGRFGFFNVVKGNPNFLADIPRTLSYVKKNLSKYPELADLQAALAKYVPELR